MASVVLVCVLLVVAVFGLEVENADFIASSTESLPSVEILGSKNDVKLPPRSSEIADIVFPSDLEEEGKSASSPAEGGSADISTQAHSVSIMKTENESLPLKSVISSSEGPNQTPKSTIVKLESGTVQPTENAKGKPEVQVDSLTSNVEPEKPYVSTHVLKFENNSPPNEEVHLNNPNYIVPARDISKPNIAVDSGPLFVRIPIPIVESTFTSEAPKQLAPLVAVELQQVLQAAPLPAPLLGADPQALLRALASDPWASLAVNPDDKRLTALNTNGQ